MKNRIKTNVLLASALLTVTGIAHAVTLDLSSVSSLSDNFTRLTGPQLVDDSSGNYATTDSTNSASYTGFYTAGGSTPVSFSASESLTIEFDFRVASSVGSSIGIYFADSASLNNNVLVLLNVDQASSDTRERFRVFTDGTPSSAGAGTNVNDASSATTVSAGAADWSHYSVTFSVVGTTPTVSLTTGGHTFSYTLASGTADWTSTVIGLRLTDTNTSSGAGIDIRLTPVPEPAVAALVTGIGSLVSVLCIRRLRRGK